MSEAVAEAPKPGAEKKDPPKDTRTQEELRAEEKKFSEAWFASPPARRPVIPPDPDEPKEPVTPAPAAASAAAAPAKPAEPKVDEAKTELDNLAGKGTPKTPETPVAPVQPAAFDPEELTSRIVEGVTGALKPGQPASPAPSQPTDKDAAYEAADRRRLRALEHLEKKNPKYKGVADQTREFFTREAAYKANWTKENPSETFDPEAAEHNEFYQKFEPRHVSQADLEDALVEVRVEEVLPDKVNKAVDERLAPIQSQVLEAQRSARLTQIEPVLQDTASDAAAELIVAALPEFKDDLKDGLTKKAVDKIKTEDPEAFKLINREMSNIRGQVMEVGRMAMMGDLYSPGEANRDYQKIVDTYQEMEMAEAQKAKDKRIVRDGKTWVPQELFTKFEAAAKGDPAKLAKINKQYFIFDLNDLRGEIVKRAAGNVSSVIEIAKERVERTSKKSPSNGSNDNPDPPRNGQQKPVETTTPPLASASDNVDGGIPKIPGTRSEKEKLRDAWFN